MNQVTASVVIEIDAFYADAKTYWEQARKQAAWEMVEPLQTMSYLSFCKSVDDEGFPVMQCRQEDAKYAVCMVSVRDLGAEADLPIWEPLCSQRRPSAKRRQVLS